MKINVSVGEAVDRLSILFIKRERILDDVKNKRVSIEYAPLRFLLESTLIPGSYVDIEEHDLFKQLVEINKRLWDIEDAIRTKDFDNEFDNEFIELARSVYRENEKRSHCKKLLDGIYNSTFTEEKQYAKFE